MSLRLNYEGIAQQIVDQRGKPTVHQNGFIQLPLVSLGGEYRLHVWPDGPVKRQRTDSPIHDHRWGFRSQVIVGALTNVAYDIVADPNGFYRVHLADDILIPTDVRVGAVPLPSHRMVPGTEYEMPARRFHNSVPDGLTMTVMKKDLPVQHPETRARVLCPWNEAPDNDYKRDDNDPSVLWEYIERGVVGPMSPSPKGEKHGRHKLTEAQVKEIRRPWAEEKPRPTQMTLACDYDVTQGAVWQILARWNWKHV